MGEGEGDYCIYEIAPPDSQLPKGSLIPIPDVPRFETTAEAIRWIRNDSGDSLAGKAVMIFLAMEMLRINVTNQPRLDIERKPKVLVHDPEKVDG